MAVNEQEERGAPSAPDTRGVWTMRRAIIVAIVLLLAGLAALVVLLLGLLQPKHISSTPEPPPGITFVKSFANGDGSRLRNPLGIALIGGRVYVAESEAGVVRVFSTEGTAVATLTLPKRSDGTTAYPYAVADLGGGRIGVVDLAGSHVVLVSVAEKEFGKVLGILGASKPKTMPRRPTAIAKSGDNVIVADAEDHMLKEYDFRGDLVRELGRQLVPQLTFVGGMATDGTKLLVSDSNAGRLVLVPLDGRSPSVLPTRLSLPRGVSTSSLGVIVADPFSRSVAVYSSSGASVARLPAPESGWSPAGVAWLESERRCYVTDPSSGKVLIFSVPRE